jgi:hypothetical protein
VPILRKIAVAVLTPAICLSVAFADAVQKTPVHKSHKKAEAAQIPPYTPHALSPLPLEQMPAVPPEVRYSAGQLTIVAHNSTLGDILRAVHSQTGAELEVPSNANERVVATLGPGPARDVLATLLNGTHFNYVMLGTPGDPTAVQRVVLTAKTGPETSATTASAAPPGPQGMPPNRFQQPMAQTDQEPAAEDAAADAQDDSAENQPDDQNADQQQNQGQAPKTPEQLLQELQRQQQQLQQQQQGQPGQPVQPGQPQVVYPNPTQPPPEQN